MLRACRSLMEQLAKALITSEVERPPVLYSDNLWAAHAGPASLLDLAARQRPCTDDVAALHIQMLDVLYAQVHLDLRSVHPYSCFNEEDGPVLFGELTASYKLPTATDAGVRGRRETLLRRWVTAAVQLIAQRADGQPEVTQTVAWVRRCQQLARGWGFPADVVRRQYTLDLYSGGHDQLAQEVLLSLSATVGLPSQLLLLAGARVRHHIHSSKDMIQLLGQLSMSVADFMKTADVPLQCPSVGLERTLALLRLVARLEQEHTHEHRLALEMVYLVESLLAEDGPGRR
ncbi:uncharacterized protein LOC119105663 [Pollicipes pollicipes]|uniref:uncharacterized protein LOC119105663 n=1 Tax=Pollicipes pollicipes TaxID=41117 RepID=UPI001884AE40|nr:uncharacterized protein LOC119105663 [Pollicipes pollicipes]